MRNKRENARENEKKKFGNSETEVMKCPLGEGGRERYMWHGRNRSCCWRQLAAAMVHRNAATTSANRFDTYSALRACKAIATLSEGNAEVKAVKERRVGCSSS